MFFSLTWWSLWRLGKAELLFCDGGLETTGDIVAIIEVIIDWLFVGVFKVERFVVTIFTSLLLSWITRYCYETEPVYEINLGIN
jgi:hypothetical protein